MMFILTGLAHSLWPASSHQHVPPIHISHNIPCVNPHDVAPAPTTRATKTPRVRLAVYVYIRRYVPPSNSNKALSKRLKC